MLQLQTEKIDICRVSKLLVRYNIKASITNQVITLEGDISEEMLTQLCGNIDIDSVQNFISKETQFDVHEEVEFAQSEETILSESVEKSEVSQEVILNEIVEEPEVSEEVIQSETEEEPQEIQEVIRDETKEESEVTTESIQDETEEESEEITEPIRVETVEDVETTQDTKAYPLIYPVVKRGQVYWCDLDFDSGVNEETGEECKKRPVIIVSNDIMNMDPKCKYVRIIPCSTTSSRCPWSYHFRFTKEIMIEKVEEAIGDRFNNASADLSKPINKNRLTEYIGTMTPEFMDKIQEIIDVAYDLKREVKTIVKKEKVYVDRPVFQNAVVNQTSQKQVEEVSAIRKQFLEYVDDSELQQILQSALPNHTKAQRILEAFDFDLKQNGVLYLLKAINISTKQSYFNMETLSADVSRKVGVAKEEVMRLIVARVKERFSLKKVSAIEFIRLINSLLLNQEEEK